MSTDRNTRSRGPFCFVIALRNPRDAKVSDWPAVEAVLRKTVESLLAQTFSDVNVIIVRHGSPPWAASVDERVRFLDVSGNSVFLPDALYTKLDRFLRWSIGALYAKAVCAADFIMLMDADDFVNTKLAETVYRLLPSLGRRDGYIVDQGVHTVLHVDKNHGVHFRKSYIVNKFNRSCGSCRIFRTQALFEKLRRISPDIDELFSQWPAADEKQTVAVPESQVDLLWRLTEGGHRDPDGVVHLIGRHTDQTEAFDFMPLDLPAAAKGCGHGNHQGSRGGGVHWKKVMEKMSQSDFLSAFGLSDEGSKPGGIPLDVLYLEACRLYHVLRRKLRRKLRQLRV